jgi:hypothetical protein
MGTTYMLSGNDSELKNHVGHQVEVTGTVDSTSGGSGSTTSSGTPTTSGTSSSTTGSAGSSASGNMSAAQHLRVLSIKMISADCSATK